jgi:hypothetical protein
MGTNSLSFANSEFAFANNLQLNTTPPTMLATTETNAVAPKEQGLPIVGEYPAKPRSVGGRKLQVSNGYPLDAPQVDRLLGFIESKPGARKISGAELTEGSGLSARQVANLVSMSSALGLITINANDTSPVVSVWGSIDQRCMAPGGLV